MAENKQMKTDDDIEQEIARLKDSYYVKLAKKEERIRSRRRQYAYQLRVYEMAFSNDGSLSEVSSDSPEIVTTAEENLQLAQPEAETAVEQVNLADL